MRFETKIAIAVRDDLAAWQRLNVTAFLASGIAATSADVIGEPYADGSGNQYLALFREPVLVYAATGAQLAVARGAAVRRAVATAVYTDDMFKTGNDRDNRAAVAAVAESELGLAGLAVYGRRADVDRVMKGFTLHP